MYTRTLILTNIHKQPAICNRIVLILERTQTSKLFTKQTRALVVVVLGHRCVDTTTRSQTRTRAFDMSYGRVRVKIAAINMLKIWPRHKPAHNM